MPFTYMQMFHSIMASLSSPSIAEHHLLKLRTWLFHLNLQLRWLLHMVMYLTQYIWDYRHTDVRTKIFGWVLLRITGVNLSVPHTMCGLWKNLNFNPGAYLHALLE